MQAKWIIGIVLGLLSGSFTAAQSLNVTERTVELERFGFVGGSCGSRQSVEFLDDDRLVLSAPLISVCDKSNWSNGLNTQLTVIDLNGAVFAAKTRHGIYAVKAGPIGYAAVCTETSLELVAGDLSTTRIIETRPGKFSPCTDIDGLSPSRTAISVRDFDEAPKSLAHHRLFDATSEQLLSEQQFVKGESLAGITDSGYAVCATVGFHGCEKLTVAGTVWAAGPLRGTPFPDNYVQGLFLSPNQLLLDEGKALMSLSPDGRFERLIDLHRFQPPHLASSRVEISAATPRKILYSATGCYIGDFDDCYGFYFGQTTLFDPQTHQALFKRQVSGYAVPHISPDGHTVIVLDKTKLHIYRIP